MRPPFWAGDLVILIGDAGAIQTRILRDGVVRLDPPRIEAEVEVFFAPLDERKRRLAGALRRFPGQASRTGFCGNIDRVLENNLTAP